MSKRKRSDLSRREFIERSAALGLFGLGGCADESGTGGAAGGASAGADSPPGTVSQAGTVSEAGTVSDAGTVSEGGSGAGTGSEAGEGPEGGSGAGTGGNGSASSSGVVVAFVKRDNIDEAVSLAVELAGGLDAIRPGQTVFIKPNAVSDRAIGTPGIRTSNEVLAAVVRLVKTRDPGRVIVGDRSARAFDTETVFESSGLAQAALDAGADEVYRAPLPDPGGDDAWMLVQPPNWQETWSAAGGLLVMRRIVEADHLINVPTCKNHRYALFSLTMKNFVGAIGDSSRDPLHYLNSIGGQFEALGRDVALLNQVFSPTMNIIDATTALVNGGPEGDGNDAVRTTPGLVLASTDRIAADTAAVALMQLELGRVDVPTPDASYVVLRGQDPWLLPQITNAIELGLGVRGVDEARLAFDGVVDEDAEAIEKHWAG